MASLRSLFLLLFACAHIGLAIAFAPTPSICRPLYPVMQEQRDKDRNLDYNDDAFGLVFLSSFVVEHDNAFAGTFGVLSAISAVMVRNKLIEYRPMIPGIVALFTVLVLTAMTPTSFHPNNVTLLQLCVCAVSLTWSIIQEVQKQADKD